MTLSHALGEIMCLTSCPIKLVASLWSGVQALVPWSPCLKLGLRMEHVPACLSMTLDPTGASAEASTPGQVRYVKTEP